MIQWKQHTVLFTGIAALTMSASAVPLNFDRYQVILDKAPFGSVEAPPVTLAPTPVISDAQAWTKNFRLSMLQEEMDGSLLVGLVNNQTQQSILLKEGESDPESGVQFISGDYETGTVTVSKGGDVRQLGVDENQAKSTSPPQSRGAVPGKPPALTSSIGSSSAASSYAARRAERQQRLTDLRQQRETSATQPPVLPPSALKEHLEKMQMEAIRKGAPPLPVPLTPAMEQQLIKEGVLTQ